VPADRSGHRDQRSHHNGKRLVPDELTFAGRRD
jgi:hypothetical protein